MEKYLILHIPAMNKTILLALCCAFLCSGCTDKKEQMVGLAKATLEKSVKKPETLNIIGMTQPDSTFGSYYTANEIQGILKIMNRVTETIMKRTAYMTKFDPEDSYVMSLATRQMAAGAEMVEKGMQSDKKEAWNGWKVKLDYACKDDVGDDCRAEKWYFFDKTGEHITDSLELPLP